MTSMKKIRTQILGQRSVNVHSNMLHLRVKIGFYFSVSIKPLGETPKKSPFPFTHVRNYSHLGRTGQRATEPTGPCLRGNRANTEGLFRIPAHSRLLAATPPI